MESESKRAILAVILSGVVLFGWQYLFPTPPVVPTAPATNNSEVVKTNNNVENNQPTTAATNQEVVAKNIENNNKQIEKSTFTLTLNTAKYVYDNSLKLIAANSVNSKETYPEIYDKVESQIIFIVDGKEYTPFFQVEQANEYYVNLKDPNNIINGTMVLGETGIIQFNFTSAKQFGYKFMFKTNEAEGESFISNFQPKQYLLYDKELNTVAIGDSEDKTESNLKWFGPDYNYHFLASIFNDDQIRTSKVFENGSMIVSSIKNANTLSFRQVFVQKNYDQLIALGTNGEKNDKLELSVDFGIFSIIAVPILRGLQFFFDIFQNYGVAIIFLTILIRMLTFPLQYKSFKSMKKMQVIQPELTKIREKYKENPQKMQQETMALFKRAGANPLSGCLPLFLQMPIFFAFYKVLYSSVELVDAEFILWIVDLSEKDPYYVLPVLMSLAMFLNMKLTPQTSADPAQQKIMMFMPILFGFMMMSLPAGLTLYILISTVVGMLQQLFVYKRVS